jgi:hypothetical protein
LTGSLDLFRRLCEIGADLVGLHLLAEDYPAASWAHKSGRRWPLTDCRTRFIGAGGPEISRGFPRFERGRISINRGSYFEGVAEDVWGFHVGGYRVCEKWLKDRRGRTLAKKDVARYGQIVAAVTETIRSVGKIDDVIDSHGGWASAFDTMHAECT